VLYSMHFRGPFPRGGVKPTTHLHVMPKSRMCGAVPPLSKRVFIEWCLINIWTSFFFFCLYNHGVSNMRCVLHQFYWHIIRLVSFPICVCYLVGKLVDQLGIRDITFIMNDKLREKFVVSSNILVQFIIHLRLFKHHENMGSEE
jgi:hypothetical protein